MANSETWSSLENTSLEEIRIGIWIVIDVFLVVLEYQELLSGVHEQARRS